MTTYENLPPRQKSQRLLAKAKARTQESQTLENMVTISNPVMTDLYPGLNDITDAFEAFPMELVRYFTLIKEIDAKCVNTVPYLKAYITKFLVMEKAHPKRERLLTLIRDLIKELMPCMEEKMQVATLAADTVRKHLNRIDDDFVLIERDEIPANIRIGPLDHPAILSDSKLADPAKSAQAQRSELRRETLAAKKANQTGDDEESAGTSTPAPTSSRKTVKTTARTAGKEPVFQTTPTIVAPVPNAVSGKKRKTAATNTHNGSNNHSSTGDGNSRFTEPPELEESRPLSPPNAKRRQTSKKKGVNGPGALERDEDGLDAEDAGPSTPSHEPVYCYCQQVSYGEMVACDGSGCVIEWFHLPCTGLNAPPKGKWYCNDCKAKMKKR
ncbi:unnamed protein product [Kuraishia capsulata CBS 1993]|uniref:Chromatin modification-related protein n=1 Tax=Kuraishia capsulata CBS 1993 TaxID=1382522 RepID=W6MPA6_9ASCO|nr:uncharacterized protein KUCA_T00002914001 [Kuraishia capsulata CBS 1993]CDK26937.1 unnamed protein product [Kuraishia capsulata CBS 1993]